MITQQYITLSEIIKTEENTQLIVKFTDKAASKQLK
jgi:hypothetical protein